MIKGTCRGPTHWVLHIDYVTKARGFDAEVRVGECVRVWLCLCLCVCVVVPVCLLFDVKFVLGCCSTSLPGGNQVDGLPPALSYCAITCDTLTRDLGWGDKGKCSHRCPYRHAIVGALATPNAGFKLEWREPVPVHMFLSICCCRVFFRDSSPGFRLQRQMDKCAHTCPYRHSSAGLLATFQSGI